MVTRAKQASKNICNLIKKGIANSEKSKDFWTRMNEAVKTEDFDVVKEIYSEPIGAIHDEKRHIKTLQKFHKNSIK